MNSETPADPLAAAAQHAELSLPPFRLSGASLATRVIERLSRFLIEPQRAYNRGVTDAIRLLRQNDQDLVRRITLQGEDYHRVADRLQSDLTELELALADGQTTAGLTTGQVLDLARSFQRLESRMAQLDADLRPEKGTEREQNQDQE